MRIGRAFRFAFISDETGQLWPTAALSIGHVSSGS
jgi:hypothetical protein